MVLAVVATVIELLLEQLLPASVITFAFLWLAAQPLPQEGLAVWGYC